MPVDSFSRVADSLKGALAAAKPLDILRPAVGIVGFLAALGGAVGLVLLVAKAVRRLGRWKRYRWDQKPLTMFPADYRYKPDVFVNRGDRGEERLRKALAETMAQFSSAALPESANLQCSYGCSAKTESAPTCPQTMTSLTTTCCAPTGRSLSSTISQT